jgi:hypothetical protein
MGISSMQDTVRWIERRWQVFHHLWLDALWLSAILCEIFEVQNTPEPAAQLGSGNGEFPVHGRCRLFTAWDE